MNSLFVQTFTCIIGNLCYKNTKLSISIFHLRVSIIATQVQQTIAGLKSAQASFEGFTLQKGVLLALKIVAYNISEIVTPIC